MRILPPPLVAHVAARYRPLPNRPLTVLVRSSFAYAPHRSESSAGQRVTVPFLTSSADCAPGASGSSRLLFYPSSLVLFLPALLPSPPPPPHQFQLPLSPPSPLPPPLLPLRPHGVPRAPNRSPPLPPLPPLLPSHQSQLSALVSTPSQFWFLVMPPNFNKMLGSGNGTIGGMAAGVRADVGGDNTHWIAGKGCRQAGTVVSASSNRRIRRWRSNLPGGKI